LGANRNATNRRVGGAERARRRLNAPIAVFVDQLGDGCACVPGAANLRTRFSDCDSKRNALSNNAGAHMIRRTRAALLS